MYSMRTKSFALLLIAAPLLSACMGSGQAATQSVVKPPNQSDYVYKMDAAQRQQAFAQFDSAKSVELDYYVKLYQRGVPITMGGITTQYQPMLGLVVVDMDHTLIGASTVSSGKMVFAAGRNGEILGQRTKDGRTIPVPLFANSFQGMTSQALFMQGLFSLGGAALNGSVAAALSEGNSGGAVAIANAGAQLTSSTNVDVKQQTAPASGGCGSSCKPAYKAGM